MNPLKESMMSINEDFTETGSDITAEEPIS
jgi:hypothetical protein